MRRLLLPLSILLLSLPVGADWYRSDALGQAGEPVENPRPGDEEYLLRRTATEGGVLDELFLEGRLIRSRFVRELPEGGREEEIVEGGERRLTLYRGGLPLREEIEWGYILPYMVTGILNEHPRAAIAYRETDDKDKYAEFYEQLLEGLE
ncbi:MAG: hypothetical protein RQ748_12880 [Elusimicrobiales bacterium]|nr:hypothetical protein [Elusimicrobiales bacterium]